MGPDEWNWSDGTNGGGKGVWEEQVFRGDCYRAKWGKPTPKV